MNRLLWQLAGPVVAEVAASVLVGLMATACYAGQAVCLAFGLAGLLAGEAAGPLLRWAAAFATLALVRVVLLWLGELAALRTASRTKARLRARLLPQALALGADGGPGHQTGELQTTIVAGVEALETYYSRYVPAVFGAILGCTGVIACVAWADPVSALLVAVCALALPFTDRLWLRWRMPQASGLFASMGKFAAYMLDSLQGVATLKAFDAAGARRASLAEHAAALRREAMAVLYAVLMRNGATGLIGLGGVALVVAINASRTASGTIAPLTMLITLFLAREVFRPLDRLDKTFHMAWSAASAAGPIAALLDATPAVRDPARPKPLPTGTDLVFDAVTFAWPGQAPPALANLSLTVRNREFVGIVGPSGAGKSTIGTLLLRFADPQAGAVRIGGADLRELSLRDLRSRVSAVFQDIVLFHGSIEANLRIARPDASAEAIREAARIAHIHEFIESLPDGYATEVGERGAQLSGGQRQRIAIARAWLKAAPILLLDEATSNVDPASERAISASIEGLARQRSLLVIAHRLSTVRKADRILVVDGGRVVEEGNHDTLLARGGLYARLLQAQQTDLEATQGAPA